MSNTENDNWTNKETRKCYQWIIEKLDRYNIALRCGYLSEDLVSIWKAEFEGYNDINAKLVDFDEVHDALSQSYKRQADLFRECATDFELWQEHIDPNHRISFDEFESFTIKFKLYLIDFFTKDISENSVFDIKAYPNCIETAYSYREWANGWDTMGLVSENEFNILTTGKKLRDMCNYPSEYMEEEKTKYDIEHIMSFFQSDEFIEALKESDKQEIALACVSYSDAVYTHLENLFEQDQKGELEIYDET
jgi:hypothetical protein